MINSSNPGMPKRESKTRIRAFPMSMGKQYAENTWSLLKGAIEAIQKNNHYGVTFEELYRNAYSMVLHRHGQRLYNGLKQVVAEHLQTNVRDDILRARHSGFLHRLNQAWINHQTAMVMIRDIVIYMDQVYVAGNKVDNVYNLGLTIFRDQVVRYEKIRDHLRETLLDMVMRERHGEVVDRQAIKTVCQMLMTLSIGGRSVYQEDFENPFLQQSREFYKLESETLIKESNAAVYVRNVQQRIHEEAERAKQYLDESTVSRIAEVVEDELIKNHMNTIVDMEKGLIYMLEERMTEDLACMYKVFSQVQGGLATMTECVRYHIKEQGAKLFGKDLPAIEFVQNLLELKDPLDLAVKKSFNNDKYFKTTIAMEFEIILTENKNSAEFISTFIDDKMKTGVKGMSDQEIETVLDQTAALLCFLSDKDYFEIYYKQHLAKRLLLNKSMSDESERYMISKLKGECGRQFTNKLEGMFKDIAVSKTAMEEFKEHVNTFGVTLYGIDLNVRVLTTGFWPIPSTPMCAVPVAPRNAFDAFNRFYIAKHTGRQLRLNPQLGQAEIGVFKAGNEANKKPDLVIQTSTYQMCILLLFNKREQWNYTEIQTETGIPTKDLDRALLSLALGKESQRVLSVNPKPNKAKPMDKTHVFSVNESFFGSGSYKVKIQTILAKGESEIEQERMEARSEVEENRKHEIEAAIVRIMKARKVLKHADLVDQVVAQLIRRFLPTQEKIGQRVENLIEHKYIERSEEDRNIYIYVSPPQPPTE